MTSSCFLPKAFFARASASGHRRHCLAEVFVAAGTQLVRLSRDLELLETVVVEGELVRIALSPDGGRLVGCLGGDTRTCLMYIRH